jgi:geranylgeranyl pyrophosphate synthase
MRAQADLGHHPDLRAALEHLMAAGGKRIRPTLGLLIGKMLGADHQRLITLGAAVEMLHTATLVHDDLIDGALLRRGTPTLNARWSPAATVLTGDFLFGRAAKLAAETDYLPLMKLFAETLTVIVNGELTQLFSARGLVDRKNYYDRIYAKTASLFEMSTLAAAMIGTEDEAVRVAMKTFGYETGMAFQIMDDVLDFTGEQATVGKPVGSDLLNGLVTLPAIYYAESHPNDAEVKLLTEGGWGNTERMEKLVISIQASNAVRHALDEAVEHVEKALEALKPFAAATEYASLAELARYIVDRSS